MATKDAPVNNPMIDPVTEEYRVIAPGHTFKSVTEEVSRIVLTSHTPLGWWFGLLLAGSVVGILLTALTWLFLRGVGIWAITIPVAWGFAIINFVWWIGIGHAGTLISAILLLFKQGWRNSINRFAEAMTIFAVVCAGMFPLIHVGRPWLGYWLFPYPSTMNYWPQFRSPLLWDVFAVSTYATISVVFWYIGMIPDLGTLRDRSQSKLGQFFYGMLAVGWRGSVRHWVRYETASLLLAGLATPLVLSVHSVISLDFSVALMPGWHTTIFPPYFVAGAIYSGFAMVITLAVPIRRFYHLEDLITIRHIDNMNKVMLTTGIGGRVRLLHRSVHELVFGEPLGILHDVEPHVRSHRVVLLDADHVQHRAAAAAVVEEAAQERGLYVHHVADHQHRHVVRAIRNRGDQSDARLPAVVVGHLSGDEVGLCDVSGNAGAVHVPVLPVYPLPAHDPDVGAAHDAAAVEGEGSAWTTGSGGR